MLGHCFKGVLFYKRQYAGVFAGLILAAAVMSGALSVGSSVRASLLNMAEKRLGKTELVIDAHLNPVHKNFAQKLRTESLTVAPLLFMPATVSFDKERVNNITVYGVDNEFKKFFSGTPQDINEDMAYIGYSLAKRLGVKNGNDIVIRIRNNSLLPGDLPLTGSSEEQTALRLTVTVLDEKSDCNHFSLLASQIPPDNIFINLKKLQKDANMPGLLNLLLIQGAIEEKAAQVINKVWTPEDSGFTLRLVDGESAHELISTRVFLPDSLVQSSDTAAKVLTYMANSIESHGKSIPYSLVTSLTTEIKAGKSFTDLIELKEDEIILNSWTAQELQAQIGDQVTLKYYVDSADGKLREQSSDFTVRKIIAPEKLDRDLMPSFPGIADEEHCRDWEPGIPMDMTKIRNRDEKYWKTYKGTPKAIITYSKGKKIWGNRFGQTTSLRWPATQSKEGIKQFLKDKGPESSGLYLRNIRKEAKQAANNGIDFGMLFASMSFFIVAAALILAALLHGFHLESRRREMGIMLASGFTPKNVAGLFFKEGLLLSLLALIPGIPLGIFYTSQILSLLSSIWIDAVGTTDIQLALSPTVLSGGAVAFLLFAALTLKLVIRKFFTQSPVTLLHRENSEPDHHQARYGVFKMGFAFLIASAIAIIALSDHQFAITSSLLLVSVLCLSHGALEKLRTAAWGNAANFTGFAIRNLSRRQGRSLGAILLMTIGVFIVLFVASRQKNLNFSTSDNRSGTGGFEYLAQASVPLKYKPDSAEGLKQYFLDKELMASADIVSMRFHRGDDASCLNLNKAQAPQVYGVTPKDLEGRFNFTKGDWDLLSEELTDDVIPAIGDENTVLWGLQLYGGVGSHLTVLDERGRKVTLQIVGMLKSSMLQGALIIDRQHFDRLYPAESGYPLFLIDTPEQKREALIAMFKNEFEDFGLAIEDGRVRLQNFLKIESTYLVIFQMLGGLGLILGSLGFGFLIMRNIQDRQTELAAMQAIGFQRQEILKCLIKEHFLLLLWAVLAGSLCAFISWIPNLVTKGELPTERILTILLLTVIIGAFSCFFSASFSMRRGLYQILKNE